MEQLTVKRLESLDVLRGFDMFFIMCMDPIPCIFYALGTALGHEHHWLTQQFEHVPWIGFHFYDLIFPLFLFIAGVTWPYSLAKKRERGVCSGRIVWGCVRRGLTLFALGCFIEALGPGGDRNILQFDWPNFRLWSVIGRIGLTWAAAAIIYLFSTRRARVWTVVGILLFWWAFMRFGVAPGAPEGWNPLLTGKFTLANWIDANYLTPAHRGEGAVAMIPMVATALFGMFAGEWLRTDVAEPRKTTALFGWGLGGIVVALVMAFALGGLSCPIIKNCWSSSFALLAGGISAILLAVFHWIVDVKGWRRWGFFFKVIGMNSILCYFMARTILPYDHIERLLFGGILPHMPPLWGAFVAELGVMAFYWLILLFFYRRKIFLRA